MVTTLCFDQRNLLKMPRKIDYKRRPNRDRTFFKEWREYRNLTQERLADRIGCTKTRVSMKERGLEPYDQDYLEALADAVSTEPASLLIRNPLEPDALWSILDQLKPATRVKALEVILAFKLADDLQAA